jgi:hypothetical protein
MGLSHLNFAGKTVDLGEAGSFTVHGIALDGVAPIIFAHREALEKVWARAHAKEGDMMELATLLLEDFPQLAAEIIAYGAGDGTPEGFAQAKLIPFPAQLEALVYIGEQTFRSEDDLKKVLELIVKVASKARVGLTA